MREPFLDVNDLITDLQSLSDLELKAYLSTLSANDRNTFVQGNITTAVNKVTDSKIRKTEMGPRTTLDNCYIENGSRTISGNVKNCIIRSGQISELAKLDDKTQIIKLRKK